MALLREHHETYEPFDSTISDPLTVTGQRFKEGFHKTHSPPAQTESRSKSPTYLGSIKTP